MKGQLSRVLLCVAASHPPYLHLTTSSPKPPQSCASPSRPLPLALSMLSAILSARFRTVV